MKFLLFISFIFLYLKKTQAQVSDGFQNPKELIKLNRVHEKRVYFFKNEFDNQLTGIDTYDTLGNYLSSKMVSMNGTVSSTDTFIYDSNHHLIKKIHYDANNLRDEYNFTNNPDGKIIKSETLLRDSTTFHSVTSYEENNRLAKTVHYSNKYDPMTISSLYNEKGQLIKSTLFDKQNGTTVITCKYNSSGKIVSRNNITTDSKRFSEFKYDSNGNVYEVITTINSKHKKKEINKRRYSYYPNGLIYENFLFINNRQILSDKAYYTYY